MNIRANKRDNCTITSKWKDFSTNVNVRAMKIWVEKLGNTLFGVNSRIRTRDGICCQGILLPRFTGGPLDKNNEMKFQQPQASSSTFRYRFRRTCSQKKSCFQKICSQKKSFCSGLVNILISSLQLIFTRACYINYFDWLLSDIESVIVFHYFLKQGHLFSDPALYLFLFNKDCKSHFKGRRNLFFKTQFTVYTQPKTCDKIWHCD